eukprot:3328356-Amphidinium_carterae.1
MASKGIALEWQKKVYKSTVDEDVSDSDNCNVLAKMLNVASVNQICDADGYAVRHGETHQVAEHRPQN